jgi:hypothetical protein
MRFDMVKVNQFKEEHVESDGSEDFLRGLGFKDPFHRELLSTEGTDQEGSAGAVQEIKADRMKYPLKQFMTQEKLKQVNNLLENKKEYSTILANLLFSANNPFQEGFPFVEDTSFKKKLAKEHQKAFKKKGIMAKLYLESEKTAHGDHNDDETSDEEDLKKSRFPKVVDMYSILHELDQVKAARDEAYA